MKSLSCFVWLLLGCLSVCDDFASRYSQSFRFSFRWEIPEVFKWIKEKSKLSEHEMLRTFNCGIGMVVIVPSDCTVYTKDLIPLGNVIKGDKPMIISDLF